MGGIGRSWVLSTFVLSQIVTASLAYNLYQDPSQPIEARVKDLLDRMTLEEKIGQMTQIERSVANDSNVQRFLVGSVLSGGGSVPTPNAVTAWQDMVDGFQAQALATRLKIPIIYGVDALHGHNNVIGATIFPHNIGLGATRDPDLVKRIGAATALEVRSTGIPWTFAPCIAVCQDPRWGRCYESYSEDTNLVRQMTDIIFGLQGEPADKTAGVPYFGDGRNVLATAKHWVGDGGTVMGIDENNTVIGYKSLVRIHMAPYFDAIAKGVGSVMVSYSSWNGVKMHANRFLITKVLKKQLGFKGFVISDWQGLDRITAPPNANSTNYTNDVLDGINAGIDMVMVPYIMQDEYISNLTALVNMGLVKVKRINDAVTRILRVKFRMGIFEHPYADRSLSDQLGKADHRALGREAVRKSLVLLKNGKIPGEPVLPLSKTPKKVLVVGTHADDIGRQCGGWTITWQGGNGSITNGTTVLQGIKQALPPATEIVYEQTPGPGFAKSQNPEYAVVVVGEPPYAEYNGDSLNLTIPEEGISTLENVCKEVKCVVVLITGRPVVIEPYLPVIDALVAAWLPGTEGNGIADVLFGDFDFVGLSSRTWFKAVHQLPMRLGSKHYDPLFPFGFGLKYGKQP